MYVHVDVIQRRRPIAWAADLCPICRDLRAFQVCEVRRVTRVYLIPIGNGALEAHEIVCADCGLVMAGPEGGYIGLSRWRRDPAKLVELTNPGVLDRGEAWFDRQRRVARGQLGPNERIDEILGVLESLEHMTRNRPRGAWEEWAAGLSVVILVALLIGAGLAWSMPRSMNLTWKVAVTGAALVSLLVAISLLLGNAGMTVRRMLTPRLVRGLEALEPTLRELETALAAGRSQGLLMARHIKARRLHQELTRDRFRPMVLESSGAA